MANTNIDAPADAAGLVQVQPGAVVSNTLVKGKSGTVTLFAFDAGEGLSEHTAPFDALVLGMEGQATFTVADASHALGAGQLIRLPANVPHAVQADTPFKMMLVMVREPRGAGDGG
jgi:quercetin dioxygenase-like cupin family protein